jgi:PHD/YefM family antitoxin component YafN of YafNO toxin-antitoxin module
MQRTISELKSLTGDELSMMFGRLNEPLLVTENGEPRFIAQSLPAFEFMVRRLRLLEAEHKERVAIHQRRAAQGRSSESGKIIPFRR